MNVQIVIAKKMAAKQKYFIIPPGIFPVARKSKIKKNTTKTSNNEYKKDCLKRLLGLRVKLVKSISNHRLILAVYYVSWLKSTYTQQG